MDLNPWILLSVIIIQRLLEDLNESHHPIGCLTVQVALCEQLLSHLAKFVPQSQPTESPTTTASVKETNNAAFEGMKVVTKAKTDDEFEGRLLLQALRHSSF